MVAKKDDSINEEVSGRVRVRNWVREYLAGKSEVKAPDVTKRAMEHFGRDDAFMIALGREVLRKIVYNIVLAAIANTRQLLPIVESDEPTNISVPPDFDEISGDVVELPSHDDIADPIPFDGVRAETTVAPDLVVGPTAKATALQERFSKWLEHSSGRHIVLVAMSYTDLVGAVSERCAQVAPEMATIDFLKELAKRLRGTKFTVGQKFTAEEIEAIRQASLRKYKVAA